MLVSDLIAVEFVCNNMSSHDEVRFLIYCDVDVNVMS